MCEGAIDAEGNISDTDDGHRKLGASDMACGTG